jgi:hypothetical protein
MFPSQTVLASALTGKMPFYRCLSEYGITDWSELSHAVGVIGVPIAAVVFLFQVGVALHQRRIEQRSTKAALAREFLGKLFDDPLSRDALRMLDWKARSFTVGGQQIEISEADVVNGLRVAPQRFDVPLSNINKGPNPALVFSPKESYVRDCFECLYDQFDVLEHYIQRQLINVVDLYPQLSYYVKKIKAELPAHVSFLDAYQYKLSLRFLARFQS